MIIEITTPSNGQTKLVKVTHFNALDGWDYQRRFIEFAQTKDPKVRREYTMAILSHSFVILDELELKLETDALINNHLQDWQNIKKVFEGVLRHNGIDPETHAEKLGYWADAGAEMAVNFVAQLPQLIIPLLAQFEAEKGQPKGE